MSCDAACSGPSNYFVGDAGTLITVDTCSDITAATLAALDVMKPDGSTDRWVGSVVDTTKIQYVVSVGDFDQVGEYRLQAYIEMPGWQGWGNTVTFKVSARFQ